MGGSTAQQLITRLSQEVNAVRTENQMLTATFGAFRTMLVLVSEDVKGDERYTQMRLFIQKMLRGAEHSKPAMELYSEYIKEKKDGKTENSGN